MPCPTFPQPSPIRHMALILNANTCFCLTPCPGYRGLSLPANWEVPERNAQKPGINAPALSSIRRDTSEVSWILPPKAPIRIQPQASTEVTGLLTLPALTPALPWPPLPLPFLGSITCPSKLHPRSSVSGPTSRNTQTKKTLPWHQTNHNLQ